MKHLLIATLTLLAFALSDSSDAADRSDASDPSTSKTLKFITHRIGAFRSEACGVGDFNNDGKLDLVGGEFLYLAPDFKPVKIRTLKGKVDDQGKGYYWDFMNQPFDIDGDGKLDIISCDWFQTHATWFRNIGTAPGVAEWPEALIEKNGNFECGELCDVDGDGKAREIVPSVPRTVWYEVLKDKDNDGKTTFAVHVVSEKKFDYGFGVGDVNGDGRPDFIRPGAWYEAPADPRKGAWKEHPLILGDREEKKAQHTAQILVYDVNGDGLADLICSNAHGYGIFWYEQVRKGAQIAFNQHLMDDSWTQSHSLALGDLDGDGIPELVTGKRFMAHNGGDPKETDPLGVYYYKIHRAPEGKTGGAASGANAPAASPTPAAAVTWSKHIVSYNEGIGSGTNLCLADLDGDGDLDIIVTGKFGGPVWFENRLK
ncbi:MAG: VCBS repeat-containing protein [Candidatus Sumerlaeota bacterium]|nr:VCBS repeat-containing protein [Candidatus Sumerlaeota bacterium]